MPKPKLAQPLPSIRVRPNLVRLSISVEQQNIDTASLTRPAGRTAVEADQSGHSSPRRRAHTGHAHSTHHVGAHESRHRTNADSLLPPVLMGHTRWCSLERTHDTQVSVRQLLEYHIRWAKKAKEVDEVHTQWLYALLSRLDKPIDADMASALRSLLRRLAEDRCRLVRSPSCRACVVRVRVGVSCRVVSLIMAYAGESTRSGAACPEHPDHDHRQVLWPGWVIGRAIKERLCLGER